MPIIRTPDERFENLSDFPFTPHYLEWEGKRIHYLDESRGTPILCLHGEPTWSFLYRRMIPTLAEQHRVVAFDFIGFGKSDKYTEMDEYSFDLHQQTLLHVVETLDLRDITLIVHDWGGLIGLPTVSKMADRIANLVILNTFLPIGEPITSRGFKAWRAMVEQAGRALPIDAIMQQALPPDTPAEIIAGYNAPFPSDDYKAGAAVWPLMIPTTPEDPIAQIMVQARKDFAQWQKPTLIMFATDDPILGRGAPFFQQLIPHASYIEIAEGGHFLQDPQGPMLAKHILDFFADASLQPNSE